MVSFVVQKFLSLIRSHLIIFAFMFFAFMFFALGDISKNYWYDLCQRVFCPCSILGVLWFQVLNLDI